MASKHLVDPDLLPIVEQAPPHSFADATALWVALHGLAELQSRALLFPWPPNLLDTLIDRLVLHD